VGHGEQSRSTHAVHRGHNRCYPTTVGTVIINTSSPRTPPVRSYSIVKHLNVITTINGDHREYNATAPHNHRHTSTITPIIIPRGGGGSVVVGGEAWWWCSVKMWGCSGMREGNWWKVEACVCVACGSCVAYSRYQQEMRAPWPRQGSRCASRHSANSVYKEKHGKCSPEMQAAGSVCEQPRGSAAGAGIMKQCRQVLPYRGSKRCVQAQKVRRGAAMVEGRRYNGVQACTARQVAGATRCEQQGMWRRHNGVQRSGEGQAVGDSMRRAGPPQQVSAADAT